MSVLDELGIKYNCDKSSVGRGNASSVKTESDSDSKPLPGHDYLRKYEFFIEKFKKQSDVRFLELGIGPDWNMGASLKIWLDYFSDDNFYIQMVDINPNAENFKSPRVGVKIGDLGDVDFLKEIANETYNVIVDDASHFWEHQIIAFLNLFSSVSEGGVYIIEDMHTSFGRLKSSYSKGYELDTFEFLSHLSSLLVSNNRAESSLESYVDSKVLRNLANQIDSITFIKHSCVICKARYY